MKRIRKFNSVQEMQAFAQADYFSFLGMVKQSGKASIMVIHKHIPVTPSNLVISCTSNIVTITADNATSIQYKLSQSAEYITYTAPFAITQTVTVYAKANASDGSITASQECRYTESKATPFYIEDISGSENTVQIKKNNTSAPTLTIEKSTDGENWETMGTTSTTAITATIPANGRLYLRCRTNAWCTSSSYNYNNISTTGNCKVGGNIMSLLYGSNFTGNETTFPSGSTMNFDGALRGNTHLINASELILPATTMTNYCYSCMFFGCTSLTTAPVLPATTSATECYSAMFQGCTSLTTAPALPATTLVSKCYSGMFNGCTSLTSAPALPATTLTGNCYQYMFKNCTSLNYIKCLAITYESGSTTNWVQSVSPTGTFVKNPSMTRWTTGTDGIPSGWTVKDDVDIELTQSLNVATITINDLDEGTGYYTINGGSHILVGNGKTTIPITQEMNGQVLLVHGEFNGETVEDTLTLSWTDYSPSVTITETNNYVTINSPSADVIKYRLGSSGSFTTYTEPVYINTNTTIYVQATKTVSGVDYTTNTSQDVTHELIPPTNLVISCTNNFVTITATGADTLEYNMNGGTSFYTTYTEPFRITESGTINARATNADGSITASQAVTYIDYRPAISITEANNFVTVTAADANTILYRLGTIGEYVAYTEPVYIAEDTTIYVQATRTVAGVDYTSTASQAVTHELIPPTNLVISCANNTVTITATNATTIEYNFDGSSTYTTYTEPFAITQTVTVYAKASNSDGSITSSKECEWTTIDYSIPFYIEDISGSGNTVQIKKNNKSASTLTIEKSTDGENWERMGTTSTTTITAIIPADGKLYLRCSTNSWGASYEYNYINTTGNCKVGGNIMSLLYGNNFTGEETTFQSGSSYNLSHLFINNTHLVNASELILPATTLANYCYYQMFKGCTSLTTAPVLLPATTLAKGCYCYMFNGCTSLTTAPELPATILAEDCYSHMFDGCTSLTIAPALPATTLAKGCYLNMFNGCTSLTTAPELPATSLADNCYQGMFNGCTSLTTAPALPATTLANSCYRNMFANCTNLNYIKCLATISASYGTVDWTNGVASTGTFVKAASMSSWTTGISGIPEGWTVQDATA